MATSPKTKVASLAVLPQAKLGANVVSNSRKELTLYACGRRSRSRHAARASCQPAAAPALRETRNDGAEPPLSDFVAGERAACQLQLTFRPATFVF